MHSVAIGLNIDKSCKIEDTKGSSEDKDYLMLKDTVKDKLQMRKRTGPNCCR